MISDDMGNQSLQSSSEPFIFHDGEKVTSLSSLISKLRSLDEHTFHSFVSSHKHDFATWIATSLQNPILGQFAMKFDTKDALIAALEAYTFTKEAGGEQGSEGSVSVDDKQSEIVSSSGDTAVPKASVQTGGEVDASSTDENNTFVEGGLSSLDSEMLDSELGSPSQSPFAPAEDSGEEKEDPAAEERKAAEEKGKINLGSLNGQNSSVTEADAQRYAKVISDIKKEVNKVFIGQEDVVDKVLLALMCDAHCLLEGVPGLAKSLLVEVLRAVFSDTTFSRIQFLPDLLPTDVIGGQIYNPKNSTFVTIKGPIFANFVLADEINRAPPKTHAALMEAMQEKKINIDVEEFILDRPFLVLATQNPLENKGTYALPEAVLDRFMFKVDLKYPERRHEKIIITENATTKGKLKDKIRPVIGKKGLIELQKLVKEVYISDRIREYILDIIEATRGINKGIEGYQFVEYGAGPRATIYLGIAAKAQAITQGRNYVMPEDVAAIAPSILRHRVSLNFKGKAHNISSDKVVEEILTKINAL